MEHRHSLTRLCRGAEGRAGGRRVNTEIRFETNERDIKGYLIVCIQLREKSSQFQARDFRTIDDSGLLPNVFKSP